jgi:hypothetical protein
MTELQDIEQRFWSMVWQCTHRHPCKKCCWPWIGVRGIAVYDNPQDCYRRKDRAALFSDPRLDRPIAAHRYAYSQGNAGGVLIFPGRTVEVCHRCDYRHCCNYAHLSLGATADNGRDKRGKTFAVRSQQPVWFPDGRMLTFPCYSSRDTGERLYVIRHDPHSRHSSRVEACQ